MGGLTSFAFEVAGRIVAYPFERFSRIPVVERWLIPVVEIEDKSGLLEEKTFTFPALRQLQALTGTKEFVVEDNGNTCEIKIPNLVVAVIDSRGNYVTFPQHSVGYGAVEKTD